MQEKNRMAGPDFLTSLVLIAVGAVIFGMARDMKVFRNMLIISPGLFPMILGGVFVFFGIVIGIMALRRGGFAAALRILSPACFAGVWRSPRFRKGAAVFALILAYVLLFGNKYLAKLTFHFNLGDDIIPVNTGFIITTAAYLFLTFSYLGAMRRRTSILLSIMAALAIFYSFNKGFGIPIP